MPLLIKGIQNNLAIWGNGEFYAVAEFFVSVRCFYLCKSIFVCFEFKLPLAICRVPRICFSVVCCGSDCKFSARK